MLYLHDAAVKSVLKAYKTDRAKKRAERLRLIVISVIAGFILCTIQACKNHEPGSTAPNAFTRVQESKKLKVGYIVFPPTITKDPKSTQIGGHFATTIEEIARQADWKIEYVETSWSTFAGGLATGRFDLSISPTFITVPRALAVAFTRPLFYAGNSAVVRKGEARFKNVLDADQPGITVAVTEGEAGHEFVRANFKKAKIVVHPGSDQTLTFQDVLSGRADIALGDAYVTRRFTEQHKDSLVDLFAASPYNLTPVAWAVRRGEQDLLDFLNASIEALSSQGKLLEFERAAGAHWLHPKREWEPF